jgi:hypothetical protein
MCGRQKAEMDEFTRLGDTVRAGFVAIVGANQRGATGMLRTMTIYGLISGAVVALAITATIVFSGGAPPHSSLWLGYLIMLVALSAILVGVKQYRDSALGGVIGFWRALALGLGIAAVAGVAYVLVWETYLAVTHYTFTDEYIQAMLAAKRAKGASAAEYRDAVAAMETFRMEYDNPFFRVPETFMEIFPVGLLIALVSAALLRNPRFLPARRTV